VSIKERVARLVATAALSVAMLASAGIVPAYATIAPPTIKAPSALIMTLDGRTIWSRAPLTRRAVASCIKMLNALVARDNTKLTDIVVVPDKAVMWNGGVGLVAGQRFTIQQTLQMMLVASANDAAEAMAIHVAGTEKKYVALMNAKAKALGLTSTVAADAHGLSEKERSTAADLSVLARTVMADPVLRSIVRMSHVTVRRRNGKTATYSSTDGLIAQHYPGIEGVKTGYTSASGYCFVGAAKRGGVELLGVVMHTKSNADRFNQMRALLNWGFAHTHMRLVVSPASTMGSVTVDTILQQTVPVHPAFEASAAVFDGSGALETSVSLPASVAAPVAQGSRLGTVTVSQDGVTLATVPLVASSSVSAGAVNLTIGAPGGGRGGARAPPPPPPPPPPLTLGKL
jgi:D-alanyl-D-alanine carboxypeptidase (penicillin-binding protein 5/6)